MKLTLSHVFLITLISLLLAGAVHMGAGLVEGVQSSEGVMAKHQARLNAV